MACQVENQKLDLCITEDDEATLILSGKNSVSLIGLLQTTDPDFQPDEEDDNGFGDIFRFRDPTDNEYLGGFELRHFGLAPQLSDFDTIDLRKEETSEEEKKLK
ncbi:hypothetical protein DFQ28_003602 [Apophysomyces sp. BC1034]|nr:hypothetical protein DFQ30_003543 [Apophysomyces sp. BC1015]KAG0175340.1 hypothetical protein DFQ29_007173 [Apophysomyces sp. BC1021]KAG0189279.1 hypothetical protein DFQ28_003602 [Apophysomyces sp. BC1034]